MTFASAFNTETCFATKFSVQVFSHSNLPAEKMELWWLCIFARKLFTTFDRSNCHPLELTVINVLNPASSISLSRQGYELCAFSVSRDLYQWFSDETQLKRVNQQHKESKIAWLRLKAPAADVYTLFQTLFRCRCVTVGKKSAIQRQTTRVLTERIERIKNLFAFTFSEIKYKAAFLWIFCHWNARKKESWKV